MFLNRNITIAVINNKAYVDHIRLQTRASILLLDTDFSFNQRAPASNLLYIFMIYELAFGFYRFLLSVSPLPQVTTVTLLNYNSYLRNNDVVRIFTGVVAVMAE